MLFYPDGIHPMTDSKRQPDTGKSQEKKRNKGRLICIHAVLWFVQPRGLEEEEPESHSAYAVRVWALAIRFPVDDFWNRSSGTLRS